MKRLKNGLIEDFDYLRDEFGFIDWADMVPDKYKYPNKDWFYLHGKSVPESVDGLTEEQTIISLAGLKWLAKIRGYTKINKKIISSGPDRVVAKCTIHWIGGEELGDFAINDTVQYSDCASATKENAQGRIGELFLDTIAVNRAFARCVRNFLGINSVSDVEMDGSPTPEGGEPEQPKPTVTKPQGALEKAANEKGFNTLEDLRGSFKALEYFHKKMDDWVEFANVPAAECRKLIAKLKKMK